MRAVAIAAVLTAVLIAHAGGRPADAVSRGCDLRGYRMVADGALVDVVRARRGRPQNATHLACYGRRGRPVVLGDEYGDPGPSLSGIRVNDRFVAVRLFACDRDGVCETSVQVTDVRARRNQLYRTQGVRGLVLRGNGDIGAVVDVGDELAVVMGRDGETTVAAQGRGIEPGSLSVAGRRLAWLEAGQRRTATFPE